jgi:hypothetical protein
MRTVLRCPIRENYRDIPRRDKCCAPVSIKIAGFSSSASEDRENIREKQRIGNFGTQPPPALTTANVNNRPNFRSLPTPLRVFSQTHCVTISAIID